jgi:hypothetical protein
MPAAGCGFKVMPLSSEGRRGGLCGGADFENRNVLELIQINIIPRQNSNKHSQRRSRSLLEKEGHSDPSALKKI